MQSISLPIKGLSGGKHSFDFTIDTEFFSNFGNTQIKGADFSVTVEIERFASYLQAVCHSKGYVVVECDRCLDDLKIPIDVTSNLTVRFAAEVEQSDEDDVIVVEDSISELDLSQEVYDYICLAMPLQKVHPKGKCNPDMMKYMSSDKTNKIDDESAYSPFGNLKELIENKNN